LTNLIKNLRPFHLAFPVKNLKDTRDWYIKYLDCKIGRESSNWIDFNFFGHQISAHLSNVKSDILKTNLVNSKKIPIRHFGIILSWNHWHDLVSKLNSKDIVFFIKPCTRFKGKSGEQVTFFLEDPSENFLEFKSFKNDSSIFSTKY
jgi:extradiol dioxygenase family protein|tara:strand:+ start:694 stop:1134 length:441 start_codon:yes stop_codon:yes gene_type:complete